MSEQKSPSDESTQWWQGGSLYQIYPRSFKSASGQASGDLLGIISELDYVSKLGVQGVWLSPIYKSPMVDFGYDITDFRDIDPSFGNMQDFEKLLTECHQRSLKLVLDMVFSHTSDQHPWFIESCKDPDGPYGDWYVWANGEPDQPPNNWLSVFGGAAWTWHPERKQFYLHNFLTEQPDLNFHNTLVQEEIFNITKFWLDKGVDGFRLDACNCYFHHQSLHNNPQTFDHSSHVQDEENPYFQQAHLFDKSQPENLTFLKKLRKVVDTYDNRFLLGEIFCDREEETTHDYAQNGQPLHSTYNFSLLQNQREEGLFHNTVAKYFNISESTAWCLSNHDVMRVVSRWPDQLPRDNRAKAYLTLLSGLPGLIILYQGEELGLPEATLPPRYRLDPFGSNIDSPYPGRDGCRTPIPWSDGEFMGFSQKKPWLPIPDEHRELAISSQVTQEHTVLKHAQRLLQFRGNNSILSTGNIQFWRDDSDMVAYSRSDNSQTLVYFANFSNQKIELLEVTGGKIIDELSVGAEISRDGSLDLAPGAFGVFRLEEL